MRDSAGMTDRLYADMVAAPLREKVAFCAARTEMTADQLDEYSRAKADIYSKDLSMSAAVAHGAWVNADERWREDVLRQKPSAFVQGDRGPWRIVTLLSGTAGALLQADGREMILRVDREHPGREILRWRFVSLALPPDILLAAAVPMSPKPPARVRLLHASM